MFLEDTTTDTTTDTPTDMELTRQNVRIVNSEELPSFWSANKTTLVTVGLLVLYIIMAIITIYAVPDTDGNAWVYLLIWLPTVGIAVSSVAWLMNSKCLELQKNLKLYASDL